MSKFSTAAIGLTVFFVFGGACFATSTVTSTSCSVNVSAAFGNPGAVPVSLSQTSPTACTLAGNSGGNPYFTYNLSASATPGSASGGLTGSITTGLLSASDFYALVGNVGSAPSASGSFDASAQSQIESEFTTAGPVRVGVLSFTGSFGEDGSISNTVGLGSIVVIQNGQSTDVPGTCAFGGEGNPTYICNTVNVPILLGSSFLIEATVSVNEPSTICDENEAQTSFAESGTFTIQDLNGNAVESSLVIAPEPSTFAMIGVSVALLTVAFARRRGRAA